MIKILLVLALLMPVTAARAAELTIWSALTEREGTWLVEQIEAFKRVFDVSVEVVELEIGEIKQNMLLEAPDGRGPDLILPVPHDQIVEVVQGGVVLDLTRYTTASYLEDPMPSAIEAFTVDGVLYGLPLYVDGPALIVNLEFVDRAPVTFDEFVDVVQLSDSDYHGFLFDIANLYFAYAFIRGEGGYVFGSASDADGALDTTDIGLATGEAARGVSRLRELVELGLPPATDYRTAHESFAAGRAAMTFNGPWGIADYLAAGLHVEVAPLPGAHGAPYQGFMGAHGVLISHYSEHKTQAANLSKWLTRSQAQLALSDVALRVPASREAAASLEDDPIVSGFAAALDGAEPVPIVAEMDRVWGPISEALAILLHDPDEVPQEVLAVAVDRILGR